MKIYKIILPLSLMAALSSFASAPLSTNTAPLGSLTYTNSNPTNFLWDFSAVPFLQDLTNDIVEIKPGSTNDVEVGYADAFVQNGAGKFVGSGATTAVIFPEGNIDTNSVSTNVPADYKVSGSITSSKGIAHVTFSSTVTAKGVEIESHGVTKAHTVSATENVTVSIDGITGAITGREKHSASASGVGSLSDTTVIDDTVTNVPGFGDGTWVLSLNDITNTTPTKLTGTATVTLNNSTNAPTTYNFNVSGTYSESKTNTVLHLVGVGTGKGSALTVTFSSTNLTAITGTVSGQSIKIKQTP